jgi:hypothetical protein
MEQKNDDDDQSAEDRRNEETVAKGAMALGEARDHAWKYFTLNADQRLRTFNFYLITTGLVVGGLLTYLKDARSPIVIMLGGFVLTVLSVIFWLLDRRVKEFIDCGRDILMGIEQAPSSPIAEKFRIFLKQHERTLELQKHGEGGLIPWKWRGHWGYYACFVATFQIFGTLGILVIIVGVVLLCLSGSSGSAPPVAPPIPVQNFYIGNQATKPGQ